MTIALRRPSRALALVAAVAFAVAACGGTTASTTPQDSAEIAACQTLNDLQASISAFRTLVPVTTDLQTVQTARTEISAQWTALEAELAAVEGVDTAAFETAVTELGTAVQSLPSDAPLADSYDDVQAASDALVTEYDALAKDLGCTS